MKHFALLALLALASCATGYQPQSFTGGFSDYLTAPDEAVITFHGNGYTSVERVIEMTALRCADVTLKNRYRYFVGTSIADLSSQSSFTTPGYAQTYGSATAFGNYATGTATTTIIHLKRLTFINRPSWFRSRCRMMKSHSSLSGWWSMVKRFVLEMQLS